LVGGNLINFNGQPANNIVRLNADGSIDNTFIQQGSGFNGVVRDIQLDPAGTIIVAGDFTSYNGTTRSRLARLNGDGTLNGSFIPVTINSAVTDIAIQTDGKILISGIFTAIEGGAIGRIARLNSNGSLDAAFTIGSGFNDLVTSLKIQTNEKILVGGEFTSYNGIAANRITRIMPDGSLDSDFDIGTGPNGIVRAVLFQPDHKIVLAGNITEMNGNSINGICRLMEDGSVDIGFNASGSGFNSSVANPMDLAQQADGKILLGGTFDTFNGVARPDLARLETNGSLDLSFGSTDQFGLSIPGIAVQLMSISIQSDGKAICAGLFTSFGGVSRNRILRLNGDCVQSIWYTDADNDSYGDPNAVIMACTQPPGTAANGEDCDDNDPIVGAPTDLWYPDTDGDGYGNFSGELFACIQPAGFVVDNTDCDDNDPLHHEILLWYFDADGDDFGDPNSSQGFCTPIPGYVLDNTDCDDFDPMVTTGTVWFIDSDGDGFGSPVGATVACTMPPGYAPDPTDCDDNDPLILGAITYYMDQDGDGSGDPNNSILSCSPVAGYVTNGNDCNDNDPLDITGPTWFADTDFDGFGDPNVTLIACSQPDEYVANSDDCNDNDPFVNLGPIWYPDADGDGYGASFGEVFACSQPVGFTADNTDCDDNDPLHHEILMWYSDADGDGFGDPNTMQFFCTPFAGYVLDNTDCDDTSEFIYIGASCDDLNPNTANDLIDATCTCVGTVSPTVVIDATVWLQGADRITSLMGGELATGGYIPLLEPYTEIGYVFNGGGGETTTLQLLNPSPGNDALMAVDWIVMEIREALSPTTVVSSRAYLLQRNGHLREANSMEPPTFSIDLGSYYISFYHRNHLRFYTSNVYLLENGTSLSIDLTVPGQAMTAPEALTLVNGRSAMWAGDCRANEDVKYTGGGNDRDIILTRIGGVAPTNSVSGYFLEDVNLDGIVRYTGSNNDRDLILQNIGGIVPTNVRYPVAP